MPTIGRGPYRAYFAFSSSAEREEPTHASLLGRRTHSFVERRRHVPREWFTVPELQSKRSDWAAAVSRRKTMVGDWLGRVSAGRAQPRDGGVPVLKGISETITASRWILDLKEDWDEQGSPGYKEATWRRACDFLQRQANFARQTLGDELPVPKILPGPEGSVDLHWKMSRFELLVNVPDDPAKSATFYGDDYGDLCIRGSLNTSEEIAGLIVWLLT